MQRLAVHTPVLGTPAGLRWSRAASAASRARPLCSMRRQESTAAAPSAEELVIATATVVDPAAAAAAAAPHAEGTDESIDESVHAATAHLRRALVAWTMVEKDKASKAAVARVQAVRDRQDAAAGDVPPQAATASTATTATATDSGNALGGPYDEAGTLSFIRNKRVKFWDGLVHSPATDATQSPPPPLPPSSPACARPIADSAGHSGASDEPLHPFRSHYKIDLAAALAELLNCDTAVGPLLLGQLSAESRRLLLVMGTANEYFGSSYKNLVAEVKAADKDQDSAISEKEYEQWAQSSLQRCHQRSPERQPTAAETASAAPLPPTVGSSSSSGHPVAAPAFDGPGGEEATPQSAFAENASAELSGAPDHASSGGAPARTVNPILRAIQAHPDRLVGALNDTSRSVVRDSVGSLLDGTVAPSAAARKETDANTTLQAVGALSALQYVLSVKETVPALGGDGAATTTTTAGVVTGPATSAPHAQTREQRRAARAADPSRIPWRTYTRLLLSAGAPFLAFGTLDNTILILTGDAVDRYLSESFNLTQMAAAAVGGTVSGIAGIQVHGLAERWTRHTPPALTPQQQNSKSYARINNLGNMVGMIAGLVLGMTPLLFLRSGADKDEEQDKAALQNAADRTRRDRHQRSEVLRQQFKERELIEFEERQNRKLALEGFQEYINAAKDVANHA